MAAARKIRTVKRDLLIAVAAVVVVAAGAFALNAVRPNVPPTPSHPFVASSSPSATSAGTPKKEGPVVMRVNGEAVTEAEFEAFAASAPPEARPFYSTLEGRKALADEVAKVKILEQEGARRGLADDATFAGHLEAVRAQLLATRAMQKIVTDRLAGDLSSEYAEEQKNVVTLRHIAVAYEGSTLQPRSGGKPLTAEQAMQKASSLAAQLKAGADFGKLAAENSDDTQSAARGGSLGTVRYENLPPEVAVLARKMKPGDFTPPTQTPFGVHIFKVDPTPVEELKPMIAQRIQQEAIESAIKELQKKAKIELEPKYFPTAPPKSNG
jgi:peptidyl-prolyl cis-trans isomerase C